MIKYFSKHNDWLWLTVLGLTLIVLLARFILAWQGQFTFSWDFARDMLWVRQLTIQHKPMLVGAWGSLNGSYFGPAYFYLLAIPALISGGDPRAAVMMVTIFLTGLVPLAYLFGRRWFNHDLGLIWAILFALSPVFWQLSLNSFPQQLIPVIFLLLLVAEWRLLVKPSIGLVAVTWSLASLLLNFEPADVPMAYMSVLGVQGYLLYRKRVRLSFKFILAAGIGLLLPLVPNIIFDLRHGWTQVQAFIQILTGRDTSLGGGLAWYQRLADRPEQYFFMYLKTFFNGMKGLGLIVTGGLAVWIIKRKVWRKKQNTIIKEIEFLKLIGWNLGISLVYFIIFPRLLKDYYLYFLPVLLVLTAGLILEILMKLHPLNRTVIYGGLAGILILSSGYWLLTGAIKPGGETYHVQMKVVETIYNRTQGQPFKVFTYTPLIYDYAYQYLFSWYGDKKYGYIPADYAYKPNQPGYVLEKGRFDQNKKRGLTNDGESAKLTFLILEPGDHTAYSKAYWLGLFTQLPLIQEQDLPGGLVLQTRGNSPI